MTVKKNYCKTELIYRCDGWIKNMVNCTFYKNNLSIYTNANCRYYDSMFDRCRCEKAIKHHENIKKSLVSKKNSGYYIDEPKDN